MASKGTSSDESRSTDKAVSTGLDKYADFMAGKSGGCVWNEVDRDLIHHVIAEVTAVGDALLFGTARTGRAISLTLCSGKANATEYFHNATDCEDYLRSVLRALGIESVLIKGYGGS